MTNLNFKQLDKLYRSNDFPSIENDSRGIRFLKLRSMNRKATMLAFADEVNIDLTELKAKEYFEHLFDLDKISDDEINNFINSQYQIERADRADNQDYLIDQLSRLQHFDWGGSYGNSLEKNIVDNYVKKIQSFELINDEIDGSLLNSLRGYTLNSWYNHWTSILIEDLFKDHEIVLPTIGLVKKIDFFIDTIPFDLKVTYFPEELLESKLKEKDFGVELTKLKQICRKLNIFIPEDLKKKALKMHLYNKLSEDQRDDAKEFINTLDGLKKEIILEAEENPTELKRWFYENQGAPRFDASNRFFLVLTDEKDIYNSWKLKRNIVYLKEKISEHLDDLFMDMSSLETEFYWKGDQKTYNCKSDILFIKYSG